MTSGVKQVIGVSSDKVKVCKAPTRLRSTAPDLTLMFYAPCLLIDNTLFRYNSYLLRMIRAKISKGLQDRHI